MKTVKYIALAAAAVLALNACEREFEKKTIAPESEFVAPVLSEVSDVTVDANNNTVEAVVFVWTPASFGVNTQVEYSLYCKPQSDAENAKQVLLGTSYSTSYSISKSDLNALAVGDMELPRNESSPVDVWLVAAASGVNAGSVKSTNTISFNITTYDPPKDWVFFPGFYNNWGDSNDVEKWRVWEKEGGTGVYRTIVQLKEDETNTPGICPLKLYMGGSWLGGADGYVATWDGWDYGDKDGNWGVPASEPINIIEFSKSKKSASRTHLSGVGLIGSFAASGWSSDVFFEYDFSENKWVSPEVSFAAGDEFLVRLNESWDGKFKFGGPLKATSALGADVKAFELVNDGNAENIAIPEAGTYVMTLYANRTPLLLVMDKK